MCSVALIPSRSQNLKLFATANDRCNREIESKNKSAISWKIGSFLMLVLISKEVFYKKNHGKYILYLKVRNLSSKQSMIWSEDTNFILQNRYFCIY